MLSIWSRLGVFVVSAVVVAIGGTGLSSAVSGQFPQINPPPRM